MRILVVNYEYPPIGGGGGFVTRDIVEQMARSGHRLTVVTSGYRGLASVETINGIRVIRVPVFARKALEVANTVSMGSYLFTSILYCLSHFPSNSFDIINTHFAIPSGPAGFFLSKWYGLPNLLSIHGGDIYDPSKKTSPHRTPVLSQTVQFMLNSANRVVAQSTNTRENAQTYYKVKKEIAIIPLGIKKPCFPKKRREDLGLAEDEFVFCTIGRLIKRKNIHEALDILSRLKEEAKFTFLIIGEGPERANIERKIKACGLGGHVHLLGNVPDETKFQVLDLSDCYLSTALHEGFGLVFLEAMACGLPIVCHNNGGQTDFLIDGRSGFLTAAGDIEGTVHCMRMMMHDKTLWKQCSSFNTEHVQNFYIQRCAEKYIDLFEQAIADHRVNREAG